MNDSINNFLDRLQSQFACLDFPLFLRTFNPLLINIEIFDYCIEFLDNYLIFGGSHCQ